MGVPYQLPVPITREATAVVGDSEHTRAEVGDTLKTLATFPELRLSALFYSWEPAASGRVDVTQELRGPA